jgi:hypothetical protein
VYGQGVSTSGPIVLPIGSRRFRVTIDPKRDDDYDDHVPLPGLVTFEETMDPETPYTLWDDEAHGKAMLARLRDQPPCDRRDCRIYEIEHQLAAGDYSSFRPEAYVMAHGQPHWVQNEWFPSHDGKAMFPLFTFETGWGDCGNENYLVALDDDGYPLIVVHEASCS